jgi:hypothetical protein
MVTRKNFRKIHSRIVESLEPCEFAEPWKFLGFGDFLSGPVNDPVGLLRELTADFAADELCGSGVAKTSAAGPLVPSDVLTESESRFLVIRDAEESRPTEILTPKGPLGAAALPVFTAAERGDGLEHEDDGCRVIAAFSLQDVGVLRACGVPATLAFGLDGLSSNDLDGLRREFRIKLKKGPASCGGLTNVGDGRHADTARPGVANSSAGTESTQTRATSTVRGNSPGASKSPAKAGAPQRKRTLILAGWSPASVGLAAPQSFDACVAHMRELEKYLGLDMTRVFVWTPTPAELKSIRFSVGREDASGVREALLKSLSESTLELPFCDLNSDLSKVPTNYPEALQALWKIMEEKGPAIDATERKNQAWTRTLALLDDQVIRPMLQEAMAASPMQSNLRLVAATLSRALHMKSMQIAEQLAKTRGVESQKGGRLLPHTELKDLLAMTDRLVVLSREIQRTGEAEIIPMTRLSGAQPWQRLTLTGSN